MVNKPIKQSAYSGSHGVLQRYGLRHESLVVPRQLCHEQLLGAEIDGRYRIVAFQGRGGAGVVYKAMHLAQDRPVAIKVLDVSVSDDASMHKRFELELKKLSSLVHPNIVAPSDYGVAGRLPYLVLEFLEGESMDIRLARSGALPLPDVVGFGVGVLRALACAHAERVLHGDLKPGNVFIQRVAAAGEKIRLCDVGLSKVLGSQCTLGAAPGEMAPDEAADGEPDTSTDVYACGVLLYEMITGRMPFADGRQTHRRGAPPVESVPAFKVLRPDLDIPPALEAVVRRAMAMLPSHRFSDAGAMLSAFEEAVGLPCETRAATLPQTIGRPSAPGIASSAMPLSPTLPRAAHSSGVHRRRDRGHHGTGDRALGVFEAGRVWGADARSSGRRNLERGLALALIVLGGGGGLWWLSGQPDRDAASTVSSVSSRLAHHAAPSFATGTSTVRSVTEGMASEDAVREAAGAAADASAAVRAAEAAEASVEPRGTEALATPLWDYGFESPSPEELEPFEALLERGGKVSWDEVRGLRATRRIYPDDPRPSLVLGHLLFAQSWYKDALRWYAAALETSGEALRDRRLVENLLVMATTVSAKRAEAARLYATYVGAQGLPLVDAAINRHIDEPQRRRLLVALKELIERAVITVAEPPVNASADGCAGAQKRCGKEQVAAGPDAQL